MYKATCLFVLLFIISNVSHAQPWIYDFGMAIDSLKTSGSESTTFLSTPPSGTARVKVASSGGGGFYLQNPGLASLGNGSELCIMLPSSTNVTKFSVYDYAAGKQGYIQFDLILGGKTGGNASPGEGYFTLGNGAMFADNNGFHGGYAFSGIKWIFGASGALTTTYRKGADWLALGSNPFSQGYIYRVEIYANNGLESSSYAKNGISYTLPTNKQDIWVNGIMIGENLDKGQLANDTDIDSFLFYGLSSTSNVANIFLDNLVYSNTLPTYPASQASNVFLSNIQENQLTINWASGSGDKSLVIVSTAENILDPLDGTDPIANSVFAAKGQQVVYSGTGSAVTVSNLSSGTNYWIKVYEVSGSGLTTRFNTSTASGNFTDVASETLPVELSSFTAGLDAYGFVQLSWVTQSETNTYGFYVLRATENQISAAEIVSPLIAATNTSTQQLYQYTDATVWQSGDYYYWLQSCDLDGSSDFHGPVACFYSPDSGQQIPDIPLPGGISSIYPNPFNPTTTVSFVACKAGQVELDIYNLKGQKLRSYHSFHPLPGKYTQVWDGRDSEGTACSSGVYKVVLLENGKRYCRKMVLSK